MRNNLNNTFVFINKCKKVHFDKYNYSLVEYSKLCNKVSIICEKHGEFKQRAQSHLMGSGCKKCYDESRNPTFLDFIESANKIHNNKYEYSGYISLKRKLSIFCKEHGEFKQLASKHLLKQGCPVCFRESTRLKHSDFLKKSIKIHNDKYDYSLVEYINHSTKVTIICSTHGKFHQTPNNHICRKQGCPKCSINISKMETDWLDRIDNSSMIRQYKIIFDDKVYKVDGYDPVTKTIYEFYGDFWHGNINIYNSNDYNKVSKKKFIDLYNKTIIREKELIENGYNVISIWENEFKKL